MLVKGVTAGCPYPSTFLGLKRNIPDKLGYYSALSISRHCSLYNLRQKPHSSPVRARYGCRSWVQIWPKFYHWHCCAVWTIVSYMTVIYRESIVPILQMYGSLSGQAINSHDIDNVELTRKYFDYISGWNMKENGNVFYVCRNKLCRCASLSPYMCALSGTYLEIVFFSWLSNFKQSQNVWFASFMILFRPYDIYFRSVSWAMGMKFPAATCCVWILHYVELIMRNMSKLIIVS